MPERWYDIPELGRVPSVTTVLGILDKPYLRQWAVNQALKYIEINLNIKDVTALLQEAKTAHEEVAEDAANVGTKTHALINKLFTYDWQKIKNNTVNPRAWLEEEKDFRVHACFRAALQWIKEVNYAPLASEKFVYSAKYKVAGTCDSVGTFGDNEKMVLIDFKSANSLWPIYDLQCAAYAKLWEERTNQKIKEAWLVKLGKDDGVFETKQVKNIPFLWQTFKNIVKVFYAMKKVEELARDKIIERI